MNWIQLPMFQQRDEVHPVPEGWKIKQIESLYENLPPGKLFENKTVFEQGIVPVINQSADTVIGYHNEEPGVIASIDRPVATFANHTCEMRWMTHPYSVIQNVFSMVGVEGLSDTRFFYYLTKGRVHIEEYKGHYPDFRRLWVALPPLPEQRAIASVLGALDDKIELNRRMNKTLEDMAAAIFKAWFVDFEPVHAKANGATSFPGMPQDVFDALPSGFVDSELGEIPKGWEVKPLPAIFDVNPKRVLRKGELAPHFEMKYMPTKGHAPEQWSERAFGSGMRFINGDTLVARITPCLENGKTAFVDFLEDNQVGWGSTEYIVLHPKKPIPPVFAYCLARTNDFRNFAIQNMSGTSGRQRVPATSLVHFLIANPTKELVQVFGDAVDPLFAQIRAYMGESRILAETRDTLLPKLLSGEVRIPTTDEPKSVDHTNETMETPSKKGLLDIARLAKDLEREPVAEISGSEAPVDGVIQMPILIYGETVDTLVKLAYKHHLVVPFEWMEWQTEAQEFMEDPTKLATADLETVQRLMTLHVRQERYCEGHLSSVHASGHLVALLRRIGEIAEGM